MQSDQQLFEEYKLLRSEIMYFMNKDTALLTALFSGVTAVLFFALKEKMPEGCLLSFLIIIPICSKFAYHRKQIAKISSYMVNHLETELSIHWETDIKMLKKVESMNTREKSHASDKKILRIIKFWRSSECPLMACASIFSYIYLIWIQGPCLKVNIIFITVSILMMILFVITIRMSNSISKMNTYWEYYDNLWKSIESKL